MAGPQLDKPEHGRKTGAEGSDLDSPDSSHKVDCGGPDTTRLLCSRLCRNIVQVRAFGAYFPADCRLIQLPIGHGPPPLSSFCRDLPRDTANNTSPTVVPCSWGARSQRSKTDGRDPARARAPGPSRLLQGGADDVHDYDGPQTFDDFDRWVRRRLTRSEDVPEPQAGHRARGRIPPRARVRQILAGGSRKLRHPSAGLRALGSRPTPWIGPEHLRTRCFGVVPVGPISGVCLSTGTQRGGSTVGLGSNDGLLQGVNGGGGWQNFVRITSAFSRLGAAATRILIGQVVCRDPATQILTVEFGSMATLYPQLGQFCQ